MPIEKKLEKLSKYLPIKHITTAVSKRIYSKVAETDRGTDTKMMNNEI